MARAIVIVLDSLGIGAAPDAGKFGDLGADTFGHIAEKRKQSGAAFSIPNLLKLGLGEAHRGAVGHYADGIHECETEGAFAWAAEVSSGKDTPSGHWELMGVPVHFDWGYFTDKENSFPKDLLQKIQAQSGIPGILGNCHASGTEIIQRLGQKHIETGAPIFYTSADSVFQIAAHEEYFGLERLYKLCEQVRGLLDDYNIGRVIARPFVGETPDDYVRTANRKDYSVLPPKPTVLNKLESAGGQVVGIGKISDIFAHSGISLSFKGKDLSELMDETLKAMGTAGDNTLIFTNLVDFDTLYGHRRNAEGYAQELEHFDQWLPKVISAMREDDLLVLTADHGCDPTWPGSDHTREYVPLLLSGRKVAAKSHGERQSFADLGQTLCRWFRLSPMDEGTAIDI